MAGRGDIQAGRAYIELFVKNSRLIKGLQAAKKSFTDFGREVKALGASLLAMSAAVAAPLAGATRIFAGFDDKMREVKAVSQSTGEEFERLTAKAKALGASTSFTAIEVAGLMAELGRAGFSAAQIENMTGAVLDLSRATSTDAVQASGIMAATIRQFSLGAEDATRVADGLTAAANKSFNTVEQLGEAMAYAGPVALDFGVSMEETLAVLGTLGNLGIQASNAGTTLRRLLTITGAEAEKLQGIFGVAFVDAAGNARPLVDVLEEVNAVTKDMGNAERAKKFNEAFGLLGITGASAISKSAGSTRELLKAIQDAGGVANKTAREMDAGLGGSFRMLLSAAEGVAIAVGEALAPELKTLTDTVTRVTSATIEWVKDNRELIATVAKVAAVVGAVGAGLFVLGMASSAIGMAFGGIATALTAIGAVIGFITSPMVLLTAALAAGVFAWAKWTDSGQASMQALSAFFGPLLALAQETLGGISDALMAGDLQKAGEIAVTGLQAIFAQGMAALTELIGGTLGEFLGTIGNQLVKGDLAAAWNTTVLGMGKMWAEFAEGMVAVFTVASRAIVDVWQSTVNKITDLFFDNPTIGKLALLGTGIDMDKLQADRDRMNAQLGLGPESVADEAKGAARGITGSTASGLRGTLDEWDRAMQDQTNAITSDFSSAISGGSDEIRNAADELAAKLRGDNEELAVLRAEADAARAAAAGGGPGAVGGVTAAGISGAASSTFSAAGAMALGFGGGGGPMQRVAKAAEKQVEKLDVIHKDNIRLGDKIVAAMPKFAP